ncbi:hypothetical protein KSD_92250 [Ktedonobacter sp. SOSP1-85]|nr:hypothetical protein KSD_92250 [Ktedonobacter sp. SOSP1-85]
MVAQIYSREEPLINAELLKRLALLVFITQKAQGIGKEYHKKQAQNSAQA